MEDIPENNKQRDDMPSIMELSRDQDMTPSEAGMEDHELQEILERENLDLEKFLEQGITKGTLCEKRNLTGFNSSSYGDNKRSVLESKETMKPGE